MGTRLAKIGGILQEVSGEELARQTGLEAPPTTPLGMQGIGASQDVAKMAGTGEQVRASLRETLKERAETKDVMGEAERGGARTRFNVQAIQQSLQSLEGVGALDNRVANKARSLITGASVEGAPTFANEVNTKQIEAQLLINNPLLAGEELQAAVETAKKAIVALRDNATPQNVAAVLQSLGIKATIDDTASTLANKLATTGVLTQATEQNIKKAMEDTSLLTKDIKIKDLAEDPGFDKKAVAEALKIKETDLDNMTLGEVKAQLAAYRANTFSDVDELRGVLENKFSTEAQKDFARKRLAELGAIGVTSLEQKADNIQAQAEEGDTVKVGNQQIKVEELTTKPEYMATISTALSSPEELEKLRKVDPELAGWIEKNKNGLTPILGQLAKGLVPFAKTQSEIKDYVSGVPSDLLDKVMPTWRNATDVGTQAWKDSFSATVPSFAYVLDMADKQKQSFVFSALATLPVERMKNFSTTVLQSIADNATSGEEAISLLKAYEDTENILWKAEHTYKPNKGVKIPGDITYNRRDYFDRNFTQKDKLDIISAVMKERAPEYASLDALAKAIDSLGKSPNVKDRVEARRLSGVFADIKGELSKKLNKDAIKTFKDNKKKEKQKEETVGTFKQVDDAIAGISSALSGRGDDWLKQQGSQVFLGLKAKLASLRTQFQEGSISPEEARAAAAALRGQMGAELASFWLDQNHRNKNPQAAFDALRFITDNNLQDVLPSAVKNSIVLNLDELLKLPGEPIGTTKDIMSQVRTKLLM